MIPLKAGRNVLILNTVADLICSEVLARKTTVCNPPGGVLITHLINRTNLQKLVRSPKASLSKRRHIFQMSGILPLALCLSCPLLWFSFLSVNLCWV